MNIKPSHLFIFAITFTPLIFNLSGLNIFELPKIQFLMFVTSIAIICLCLDFFKTHQVNFKYNKAVLIFTSLWLISLIISTIFSIAPEASFHGSYDRFQGLQSHLVYITIFLIFLNIFHNKENQKPFLVAGVTVASITAIHAILQQFNILTFFPYALDEFSHRSFATLGHPNFLGQFLMFPVWASIFFLITSKNKALTALATILLIIGLFTTQNRASILGLIIGLIFFLIFHPSVKKSIKYLISLVSISGFAFFVIFFASNLRSLFTRSYLWEGALKLFQKYPFLGSGLETFRYTFQQVADPKLYGLEKLYEIADRAHNQYLDILTTQGIFGLIIYLSIFITLYYLFKKSQKTPLILISFCALTSILVSQFFSFPAISDYLMLVILVALILTNTVNLKSISLKLTAKTVLPTILILIITFFSSIYSIKSIYADTLFFKGQKQLNAGNFAHSIQDMKTSITLNTHQADLYYHFSEALLLVGNARDDQNYLKLASNYIEKAAHFDNRSFIYYLFKGRNYTYLQDFQNAEKAFQKAQTLAPQNPLILREWGEMLFLSKNYSKTIAILEKYLELLPDYWQYAIDLNRRPHKQQEQYRLFLKHVPNFNQVFYYLSQSYHNLKDVEKGDYYKQFIKK